MSVFYSVDCAKIRNSRWAAHELALCLLCSRKLLASKAIAAGIKYFPCSSASLERGTSLLLLPASRHIFRWEGVDYTDIDSCDMHLGFYRSWDCKTNFLQSLSCALPLHEERETARSSRLPSAWAAPKRCFRHRPLRWPTLLLSLFCRAHRPLLLQAARRPPALVQDLHLYQRWPVDWKYKPVLPNSSYRMMVIALL